MRVGAGLEDTSDPLFIEFCTDRTPYDTNRLIQRGKEHLALLRQEVNESMNTEHGSLRALKARTQAKTSRHNLIRTKFPEPNALLALALDTAASQRRMQA